MPLKAMYEFIGVAITAASGTYHPVFKNFDDIDASYNFEREFVQDKRYWGMSSPYIWLFFLLGSDDVCDTIIVHEWFCFPLQRDFFLILISEKTIVSKALWEPFHCLEQCSQSGYGKEHNNLQSKRRLSRVVQTKRLYVKELESKWCLMATALSSQCL